MGSHYGSGPAATRLVRTFGIYGCFMAVARSGFVSMDCAEPVALAEFWAAMLGGEIMFASTTT
jgi:hypothetical protein